LCAYSSLLLFEIYLEKIRVGKDYQATIPALNRVYEDDNDKELLVWAPPPTKDIPDSKIEEYVALAKDRYGYNVEQSLGMLFWHKHDLIKAVTDLVNFTPFPEEWTYEDKVLFEQAFQFHGKCFHRIRQMVGFIQSYLAATFRFIIKLI
jgi:hypothetical protein